MGHHPKQEWESLLERQLRKCICLSPEARGTLDLLRDLNVGNIGLRGVRLATQRRDQEIVPVVHMPDREAETGSISGPPPSLDLLGLDPVATVSREGQVAMDPFWGLNLLTPGAMTPLSPVAGPSYLIDPPPVPEGPPPPGTPGKQVTFGPAVQYSTVGLQPNLEQVIVP